MDLLTLNFPDLTERQKEQFAALLPLYEEWNAKINVVSRKDMANFYEHHVLHSLAIAKVISFKPMADILDLGTGGGFPGIPLAIMFPETNFLLVDSIGKKITVAANVAQQLQLTNCHTQNVRAEQLQQQFDFVVSRAVASTAQLLQWTKGLVSKNHYHSLPNGLLLLKGGDLSEELAGLRQKATVWDLGTIFKEPFFETKKLVHLPVR
ncbi:MAG: 16S rRNA (guanine(527)-N(7))-methyltransferase RsmG [Bacteroidales bacterium]|nr:16S rRNA (guanine(527)-N(7))-methyltransferase RsmG [Bacteroidales bacterium]